MQQTAFLFASHQKLVIELATMHANKAQMDAYSWTLCKRSVFDV